MRCGICDFCASAECVTQAFRPATPGETRAGWRAIEILRENHATSAGRLHALAVSDSALDRRAFERLLGGMARAGLVVLVDDSFEKEGRRIEFKRVQLTAEGRALESPVSFTFSVTEPVAAPSLPRKKARRGKPKVKALSGTAAEVLRAWRLAEAKRRRVPAFRILSERTLHAIAAEQPQTEEALLAISGVGLRTVEKYGAAILRTLKVS